MAKVQLKCPKGWKIIKQRPGRLPNDGYVILCEKVGSRAEDTNFVTWRTAPGDGCYLGHYNEEYGKAVADFNAR